MIVTLTRPSVLEYLPRLDYQEMRIEDARLIEGIDGTIYMFLDDYISLSESGRENEIYSFYNIDPSKLAFVVDEARIINSPHYLKSNKKYIKSSKVSIRPLNTKHTVRMLEDAIEFYTEYNDATLLDKFVNEDVSAKKPKYNKVELTAKLRALKLKLSNYESRYKKLDPSHRITIRRIMKRLRSDIDTISSRLNKGGRQDMVVS